MYVLPLKSSLIAGLALLTLAGCNQKSSSPDEKGVVNLDSLRFTVEDAPEWSALFNRSAGWFGGDGIFAATLNGKESPAAAKDTETVFWFSDSMLGEITDGKLQPGYVMINNSIALLKNGTPTNSNISFHWKTTNDKSESVFVPKTPATQTGDYYWLGDGLVNQEKNNDLTIFGYRIRNVTQGNAFGFKEFGNTIITIPAGSKPPYTNHRQVDIPFFLGKDVDSTGSFGAGVFVNTKEAGANNPDGYLYIYGVRGVQKKLMVARVKPVDIEAFDKWNFWDGAGWNTDPSKIATVTDRVSNELGVMQLPDGRYAIVFQEDGIGRNVSLRLSETPYGPFGKIIPIYDCSKDLAADKDLFPYNAKVHPVLSTKDEWIISYNVNSFDFFNDIKWYPNLYRPRFIRLKLTS